MTDSIPEHVRSTIGDGRMSRGHLYDLIVYHLVERQWDDYPAFQSRPSSPPEDPSRILVMELSSIGDVACTIPALHSVSRRWLGARVDMVCEEACAVSTRGHPDVDELHEMPSEKWIDWIHQDRAEEARRELRAFLNELKSHEYDFVINFHWTPLAACINYFLGTEHTTGLTLSDRLDPVVSGNPLRQFQYCVMTGSTGGSFPMNPASIKRLSADGTGGKTKFYARTESPEYESIRTLFNEESNEGTDHLLINTGSRMEGRRWPADHCADVLRTVDERIDVEFGLIGGPTDTDRLRAIEEQLPRSISVVPWYEKTDALINDVYLSDWADLTVSTDSGPQHLISLRGNPVLDVAGDMWVGPWNRDSLVVRDESGEISQLNVDQVAEGIVRLLGDGDVMAPPGDDTTNWYAPRRPVEDLWFRHLPADSNLDTDHELSSLLSLWLWSKLARQHGWRGLPFAVRDGREIVEEWSVQPAEDTSVEDLNIVGREFLGEKILRQAGDILDGWRRG